MKVLTDGINGLNVVVAISNSAVKVAKGYDIGIAVVYDNGNLSVFDVEEATFPKGLVTQKYCFTEEKGFYINPNYYVPVDDKDVAIAELRLENADLRATLDDLISNVIPSLMPAM